MVKQRAVSAAPVASHSEPGPRHGVKVIDVVTRCDCKGDAHHRHCRHVRAVRAPALAQGQNALVHAEPQRDPLLLNERPPAPQSATPRTFEEIFGITPAA